MMPDAFGGGGVAELQRFAAYLAQAHGCEAVVPAGRRGRLPGGPEDAGRSHAGDSLPQAAGPAAGGRCLYVCRLDAREAEQAPLDALAPAAGVLALVVVGETDDGALQRMLTARDDAAFVGVAPGGSGLVGVLDAAATPRAHAPADFRVLAIVPAYNEEDVIAGTLRDLLGQGVDPIVLDNGSTDDTVAIAQAAGVPVERFPPRRGPTTTYDLAGLMTRVEDMSERARGADWVVLHDADERRRSPWPGVNLRDALWHVDLSGYNCIDHVTLTFWPTDDAFEVGGDPERHFRHFEFSDHPGHFHQRRAWKQLGRRVALARSAGHDVAFAGRRVYPYKFLLKHYPLRSRAQGARKLRERRERCSRREREWGWHRQYDATAPDDMLRDPAGLLRFDGDFHRRYPVERLSGVGVFAHPPPWATPPAW